MTVKSLVAQLCLTLCDPMHCGPLGSSVHEILQAGILGSPFSRGPSQPRDQTWVSHIAGRFFTIWITREALNDSGLFQIYPIIVPIVAVISNIVFLINSLKQPLAFSNFIFSILIRKVNQKEVTHIHKDFPGDSAGIESTCDAGDLGLIPRLGRCHGGRPGNPLQYSCLVNPHGQRSLGDCSPCCHKELDTTER